MRGFSLLEMAIVISIISVLVGGVVAGNSLMEAAKTRRAIEDIEFYRKTISQFKTMYEAYPGDFSRATQIWGVAGGTGSDSTCYQTDSSTLAGDRRATCNGNGDGFINKPIPTAPPAIWVFAERFRAWQHLANSNLINGSYSGISDSGNSVGGTPGVNIPKSALSRSAGYQLAALDHGGANLTGGACLYDGYYNANYLLLYSTLGSEFTPQDFRKIDEKMDDGLPGTGKVFTYKSTCPTQLNCTTSDVASTARYSAGNNKLCNILHFRQ